MSLFDEEQPVSREESLARRVRVLEDSLKHLIRLLRDDKYFSENQKDAMAHLERELVRSQYLNG